MSETKDVRVKALAKLWELHDVEHASLGERLLDMTPEGRASANWHGGRVNGIRAAIASPSGGRDGHDH